MNEAVREAMLRGDETTDCTHCEGGDSQSYWNISLDLDLLQTIVNFYPEWFCNMSSEGLKGIKLQNKDSSLSAFQEQRQKLVKARIGSILKHKLPKKMGNIHQLQNERSATKFELAKENIFVDAVQALKSPCNSPGMEFSLDDESDDLFSPTPPYDYNEHSQDSLPSLEASEPNQGSPCSISMSPPSSSVVSPQGEQVAPNKNKKKTKPKTQPKARTIKFHEYKGPPNSKTTCSNPESPPQLNFQQQQLILELQSAFHKHPPPAKDATQRISGDQSGERNEKQISSHPPKRMAHFEDLKVSDLRSELKKRHLPVSGSKPQLIERLKTSLTGKDIQLVGGTETDSPEVEDALSKEEIIVQLQQIYIERLQMDLERSQRQLLECQQPIPSLASSDLAVPFCPNETSLSSENKASQKQLIQQLLQQKIQKQQKSLIASSASTSNSTLTALLKSVPLNAKTEEDDFPGVIPITPTPPPPPCDRSSSLPSFSALCKTPAPPFQICKPPPDYNAATKHLQKVKQPPSESPPPKRHKSCLKSQEVDDVLAVLIASGDLPASAFQAAGDISAQSLMDMTPPSSAGLCTTPLDFGPLLDLDEMDFGLDDLSQDLGEDKSLIKTEKETEKPEDMMEWPLPLSSDSLFPNTQDALDFLEEDFSTPDELFFPWGET